MPTDPAQEPPLGGLAGLTWSACLRGWMAQFAGSESSFNWLTFALQLLPGPVIGLALGLAACQRGSQANPARWLILAPALFAVALLDPAIFGALVHTSEGGGSLMVVFTALAAGLCCPAVDGPWPV